MENGSKRATSAINLIENNEMSEIDQLRISYELASLKIMDMREQMKYFLADRERMEAERNMWRSRAQILLDPINGDKNGGSDVTHAITAKRKRNKSNEFLTQLEENDLEMKWKGLPLDGPLFSLMIRCPPMNIADAILYSIGSTPSVLVSAQPPHLIEYVSATWLELFERLDVLGLSITAMHTPCNESSSSGNLGEDLITEDVLTRGYKIKQWTVRTPSGRIITMEAQVSPVFDRKMPADLHNHDNDFYLTHFRIHVKNEEIIETTNSDVSTKLIPKSTCQHQRSHQVSGHIHDSSDEAETDADINIECVPSLSLSSKKLPFRETSTDLVSSNAYNLSNILCCCLLADTAICITGAEGILLHVNGPWQDLFCRSILESLGHHVTCVCLGVDAVSQITTAMNYTRIAYPMMSTCLVDTNSKGSAVKCVVSVEAIIDSVRGTCHFKFLFRSN